MTVHVVDVDDDDDERPQQPPPRHGLPVDDPCLSFWQQTTRSFPHLRANSDADVPLPPSTRYLIIGSGLSGALTAFELIHSAGVPADAVVLLEAREAASGASSRNAGHVRPDAFRGFAAYRRLHGTRQALAILAAERDALARLAALVRRHDVPCDLHYDDADTNAPATTLDVCLTPAFAEHCARGLREFRDAGGDAAHVVAYEDAAAARGRTGVVGAVAAYEWPAGSCHPAKLAHWLLARCIDAGARLYTFCPATRVTPSLTF